MKWELDLVKRGGARRLVDYYPHDWEILAKYYPENVALFREAVRQGYLEPVHGLYTAAYLPIFSGETNIRQLQFGLRLKRRWAPK